MRPILVFDVRKIIDEGITADQLVKINIFWVAYLIFNGMVPGKIEQFIMIVDMRGVGLHELPIQKFGEM